MSRTKLFLRWVRKRPLRLLVWAFVIVFPLLNVAAFLHARAMTTYVKGAATTGRPEELRAAGKLKALFGGVSVGRPELTTHPSDLGLESSRRELQMTDGTLLEAWVLPRANAIGCVVLCHGYAASKSSQLTAAKNFVELGYTAVLIDFRGSGGSPGQHTSLGYHEASDVAEVATYARGLAGGNQHLVLFGTSLGGAAVLRAVHSEGAKPDAVIVEATFDRLLTTVKQRFGVMGLPAWPAAELLVFWGGIQRGISGFDHNPVEYAAAVTCPILVMNGDEDTRVRVSQATRIYERASSPEKVMHVFSGLGHESYVDARPQEWFDVVRAFLRRR